MGRRRRSRPLDLRLRPRHLQQRVQDHRRQISAKANCESHPGAYHQTSCRDSWCPQGDGHFRSGEGGQASSSRRCSSSRSRYACSGHFVSCAGISEEDCTAEEEGSSCFRRSQVQGQCLPSWHRIARSPAVVPATPVTAAMDGTAGLVVGTLFS